MSTMTAQKPLLLLTSEALEAAEVVEGVEEPADQTKSPDRPSMLHLLDDPLGLLDIALGVGHLI